MEWLLALLNVIFMNTILSGDNSIVISLAANRLPEMLRKKAIVWGSVTAIGLRIILLLIGTYLIEVPFFKIAAAFLLLWVAVQLIFDSVKVEQEKSAEEKKEQQQAVQSKPVGEIAVTVEASQSKSTHSLWKAIRTIAIADFVMSLDNAVAMLGAANGYRSVLLLGLALTVPLLIWGSELMSRILQKYTWLVMIAVGVLGWTAGDMFVDDFLFQKISFQDTMQLIVPLVTGIGIVVFGIVLSVRASQTHKEKHKMA